jgi:HrpA-like RNA helicase
MPVYSDCDCLEELVTIAAMLSVGTIWAAPDPRSSAETAAYQAARAALAHPYGDMHTYLQVYTAFVAEGRSAEWCERHFLSYWALVAAERMR